MVLESLVVHLFDKYLGDYIENLDSNKLKIDLWHGDVVLENLYLKPRALANFNLPVTVTTGYLQKLLLHISWQHWSTHPIKITIDGFYLLVAPNIEVNYNAERDENEQYKAKMKEVQKVEEFRKEKETYENAKPSHKHKDTFMERLQFHFIRNLELSISNMHIAYEDKITKPGHPFAFGITLNYVKLYTTNSEWETVTSKEDSPVMYKLGELNALSIYWNSNVKSRSELSKENIVDALHATIVRNDQTAPECMNYILRPLNLKAKLKIATTPHEQDFVPPVFDGKVDLEEINLNINRNQYSDLLDLLELHDYLNLKSKYIKYYAMIESDGINKPSLRRWKFACAAIINEEVRPRLACYKWANIRNNLDQCREYHTLHFKELIGQATKKQKERAHELEKKIDVFNLIYVRRIADIEAKKKKAEQKPQSWWNKLSGWWNCNLNSENPELDLQNVLTIDEKKKLYDVIGYESDQTSSFYPEEYVDIDLSIRLNMLEVNIWSNIHDKNSQLKVIARVAVPDIGLIFKRRSAASNFLFIVDLGSLLMYGVTTEMNQEEILNDNRPVLVQPANRSQLQHEKWLHFEFETNPLGEKFDYRVRVISQSLEITYNALTINKLVECFLADRHRDLKGVKEGAHSLYTDIKQRTDFLLNYKLKKIKTLKIDIDLQSSYFLLPENGVYRHGCSTICLDFGHLTFQGGRHYNDNKEDDKNIDNARELSYIPLKLQLENIQLLYANQNEDWKNTRNERDFPMHLIKPFTVSVDVYECIYPDDGVLPIWKVSAQVSAVDAHLSDARLVGVIKLSHSIPFPKTKESLVETKIGMKSSTLKAAVPRRNTKKTFEEVENMTSVMKISKEAANAKGQERTDEQAKEVIGREKVGSQGQLTQLEATLELPRIDLRIEESLSDLIDHTQPFVRLSLVSFVARATIKTFDIEFDASLTDLIVFHEQFLTNNNDRLCLFAADRASNRENDQLISVKCLLTSPSNPLFSSAPYNSIENQTHVHFGKPVVVLQLEALLSILRFRNDLMEKLSKEQQYQISDKSKAKSDSSKVVKKSSGSTMSTFHIEVDLEEFRVIIGTEFSQILAIQVRGLKANGSQTTTKTSANLILDHFHVLDLDVRARYRKIISQQVNDNQLLRIDFSLFNYPKKYEKTLDDVDWDIKVQFAKVNIIFLYKRLDLILTILNAFQTKQTKSDASSTQTNIASEPEQRRKLRLDLTFNAPNILVPTNSHSNEGILLDLGQWTIQTRFIDDPNRSIVKQQVLIIKNVFASRVKLNNNDEILGDIILLECAELNTLLERLLHPEKIQNEPSVSIQVEWDTIDFTMSKDDYLCVTKIFKENFSENIDHKIPQTTAVQEQSTFRRTDQDEVLPNVVVKQQNDSYGHKISETIRLDIGIKKIALTLYLDKSNMNVHRAPRNENSKLVNMRIEMIEAHFRQLSDSSSNTKAQIQYFLLDDLRQTNQPGRVTRMIDRNFNVDPNAQIFIATLKFEPKKKTHTTGLRQVNAQLESLYICISPDYLMALKDFFNSRLSSDDETKSDPSILSPQTPLDIQFDLPPPAKFTSTHRRSSSESVSPSPSSRRTTMAQPASQQVSSDVETRVDFISKTPQIIVLEDQNNANSNCLVLDLAFQMRMIIVGDKTNFSGSLNDFTIYGSNFAELKDSKIHYHTLQPTKIDIVLIMNSEEQKIDIQIRDISVNIAPAAIHTIVAVKNSLDKYQTVQQDKNEKINPKSLFDPKPFKDASFWFIEKKQKMIEQTDILEVTTGTPSHKKAAIEEENNKKEKEKKIQTQKIISQRLILNLDIIEVKLELASGSSTRPVIAMCLSNLSADVKNWSSDISLDSKIQVELAFFNDHILAWEPLIEPIIDERGAVVSPWCITCSTMSHEEDENVNESRFLLDDPKSSTHTEQQRKSGGTSLDAKTVIYVRAEHLLSIVLTKTTFDLTQRLSTMFDDTCNKQLSSSEDDDDDELSMLSVHNMTGYEILIDNIVGVEFTEKNKSETSINLKHMESVPLTVPGERLSATRLPAITEHVANRRQEFSVKIDNKITTVDINQTWNRVYELGLSSIPNWPIQMLCDSHIYKDRRRVILSSIIKIYNRTIMPLVILDVDSIEMKKYHQIARIEVNGEFYFPIDLLYVRMSPRLYLGIDEGDPTEQVNDFISFGWTTESTTDRILKMKNGKEAHFVVCKESIEAYSENTDESVRTSFHIYVKLALHLINLLPIAVQCSIDSVEQVDLKPSQLYHSTSGNKKSVLTFMIPSYNNAKWVSEPVDLKIKGYGIHNERLVKFHDVITQETWRIILRVDTHHESYRASLYSPFWVLNCTDLKFEFKIDNEKMFIDIGKTPFFVCSKKFDDKTHQKGQIRLYSIEQDDTVSQWSEGFSLNVIKSTGMTSCKVSNDRIYLVSVDIVTCSFDMTKIITLMSSLIVINNSSIEIEIVETVSETEQDNWKLVKPDEIIPFWPCDIKEGVMRVRYAHNRLSSTSFVMNNKHRTLLHMNDVERPALYVEVTANDFDGIRIVFSDYKIGDVPVVLVNCLRNQSVAFTQREDIRTQVLPPQYYVYYTWIDPLKPRELVVSCSGQNATVGLNPSCGLFKTDDQQHVYYAVFHDGPQMVLIFTEESSVIEAVSNMSSLGESMSHYIQIGIRDIGISIVNDITRDDMFYITIKKSKDIWTETRKSHVRPLSRALNNRLEQNYKAHNKHLKADLNDKELAEKRHHMESHRHVSFNGDTAELTDHKGHRVRVKRQALDGLWIGYAWSTSNAELHVRINRVQIDNQLKYTMFPVVLHPIVSKAAGTDIPGKSFIELSVFKTKSPRSNTIHFRYFKLLIQEFDFCVDQGLVVSFFAFIRSGKNSAAPTVNIDTDLKRIEKPLLAIIKDQTDNRSGEIKMYFDNIHLSSLKIHVSFSMYGAEPSEQLLIEYPLADFLLQMLNIAEVQDVILKLNFYERKHDRFTTSKLITEIQHHYRNQFMKQIHVLVLGLDVLGNPFGVIRGVAEGVETFFYEPYKGAMEGPVELIEGIATGSGYLLGSVVGGAAGAGSRVTGVISEDLATLTFDKDYQNARIQRKELTGHTTSEIVRSGKNTFKDVVFGMKGVVKKPMAGAKENGTKGFVKGLGKGFIGLAVRPTSGVADFTSTSFDLIKRTATHEQVVHRVRHSRHIGRDGIVRPSTAHETIGFYIFNRLVNEKYTKTDSYIAHINCSESLPSWLMATSKHLLFVTEKSSSSDLYEVDWHFRYKELKGTPSVKFDPNQIEILLKEPKMLGKLKTNRLHGGKMVTCRNIAEARYIVDKITQIMHAMEL